MATSSASATADRIARAAQRWRSLAAGTRVAIVRWAVLVAGAGCLAAAATALARSPRPSYTLLGLVAATTVVADTTRLKVRLHHRTHAYTWMSAHLAVALTLLPAAQLIAASAAVAIGLATRRRLGPAAYATAVHVVGVTLAALVTAAVTVPSWSRPLLSFGALAAGTAVYTGWTAVASTLPLAITHRTRVRHALRRTAMRRRGTWLANLLLGVAALALAQLSAPALVALPPVLAVGYAAYRSFLRVRQDRDVWRHLEEIGQEISRLDEREVAAVAVRRGTALFNATEVELLLTSDDGAIRYVGDGDGLRLVEPTAAAADQHRLALSTYRTLEDEGPDEAREESTIHVPLEGAQGQLGVLLVRFAGRADLGRRDHQLLRTFGHTVGSSLQNARLYGAMSDQARRHETAALHDALTGLPNRVLLAERVEAALATGSSFALLMLDLDRFKAVNDTLGHAAGDQLLREVAGRLANGVRPSDTVCRLGGDEFAVLLGDGSAAETTAARLRDLLAEPATLDGTVVNVGGSVGIACYPADGTDLDSLVRHADAAMYRAKTARRALAAVGGGRDRIDLTAV